MIRDKAYIIGTNIHSFRVGQPAEIVGVEMITPDFTNFPDAKMVPRLCYNAVWADSVEDWIAVSDVENYKIVPFAEILEAYKQKT